MYKIEIHWNQCQGANEFGDLHYKWVWTQMTDGTRENGECLFATEQEALDYLQHRWKEWPYLKEDEEGKVRVVDFSPDYTI